MPVRRRSAGMPAPLSTSLKRLSFHPGGTVHTCLRLNQGAEAVEEFRRITDHKGASWASAWRYPRWGEYYSLSWLGTARGAALAGDVVNARKAFQQFFRLWKDADPDIPLLQQAKAENAGLR